MINKEKAFPKQEQIARELIHENKRIRQCTCCHQPLGIVSTMLYEIDDKLYCSECYSRMINNKAVERDHSDLMQEK